jgi:hypothetical protein
MSRGGSMSRILKENQEGLNVVSEGRSSRE